MKYIRPSTVKGKGNGIQYIFTNMFYCGTSFPNVFLSRRISSDKYHAFGNIETDFSWFINYYRIDHVG